MPAVLFPVEEMFFLAFKFLSNFTHLFVYLIYGCAESSSLYMGFLCLWERGLLSSCGAWASYWGGFSCRGARARGQMVEPGLLTGVAYRVTEHGPEGRWASVVAARGLSSWGARLSCSTARGIFPDQGLNLCLLNCKMGSLPLDPQGSSEHGDLKEKKINLHVGGSCCLPVTSTGIQSDVFSSL